MVELYIGYGPLPNSRGISLEEAHNPSKAGSEISQRIAVVVCLPYPALVIWNTVVINYLFAKLCNNLFFPRAHEYDVNTICG